LASSARLLAYVVRSSLNAEKNYAYYSIYVGTTKEAIEEVESLILEEFDKVKDMTEVQLKSAKDLLKGFRKLAAEDSTNVMQELIFLELADKAESYYTYEEVIDSITLDEVKAFAKGALKEFSTAAIVPK